MVGCLAALASMLLAWLPAGGMKGGAALLLVSSAITTASIASLLLGIVMVGVVLLSNKLRSGTNNCRSLIHKNDNIDVNLNNVAGITPTMLPPPSLPAWETSQLWDFWPGSQNCSTR